MPQELDPYGNRVVVGNITLTTPGLTGTAESYVPRAGGTRGAGHASRRDDHGCARDCDE